MTEFSPFNPIVKLCLQGMEMEEKQNKEAALEFFLQAWASATDDFEKYLSAYYVARQQASTADQLRWLEITVQHAQKVHDPAVDSAFSAIYNKLAHCYSILGNATEAAAYAQLASEHQYAIDDNGPFYHGTKADLPIGAFLKAGGVSNYQDNLIMHHIYFTAMINGAGLASALAKGDGRERIYIVTPTGPFEPDPNVTNKKFPGNPTRSYRSSSPLKITGEVMEWNRPPEVVIQQFKDKLSNNHGEIIN